MCVPIVPIHAPDNFISSSGPVSLSSSPWHSCTLSTLSSSSMEDRNCGLTAQGRPGRAFDPESACHICLIVLLSREVQHTNEPVLISPVTMTRLWLKGRSTAICWNIRSSVLVLALRSTRGTYLIRDIGPLKGAQPATIFCGLRNRLIGAIPLNLSDSVS